jgi:hypothetical protein
VTTSEPEWRTGGLEKVRLLSPPEQGSSVKILGDSAATAPQIVEMLKELRLL